MFVRASQGGGGASGAGASGTLDNPTTSTQYTIPTGLSSIKTFTIMANDQSVYGSITCYNADWSTTMVTRVGGNSKAVQEAIPSSNSGYYIGIVGISGGDVTIKTPQQGAFFGGKLLWSATS